MNETDQEMQAIDQAMNTLLNMVDVSDFDQYRDAMTEIAVHFVNALDQERIHFDDQHDQSVMLAFIGLALASNAEKHNSPTATQH